MSTPRFPLPALAAGLVAVVAATTALVLALSSSSEPTDHEAASPATTVSADAREWKAAALGDFGRLNGVVGDYLKTLGEWQTGTATAATVASRVDLVLPEFQATADALAKREPFAAAPRALDDYRKAVALYVQSARIAKAAAALPRGPLQDQVRLSSVRARHLGDRVYDQADVELAPYLPATDALEGVEFEKLPEVPEWSSLGLAAGPPLDETPATGEPRKYVEDPPQQSFESWKRDVEDADVPSASEVAAAITSGSAHELKSLSQKLTRASDELVGIDVPRREQVVATRVQLALLIDAEGTRLAQAATLAPGAAQQLRAVARSLVLIGDGLWDPRLGPRVSGFTE